MPSWLLGLAILACVIAGVWAIAKGRRHGIRDLVQKAEAAAEARAEARLTAQLTQSVNVSVPVSLGAGTPASVGSLGEREVVRYDRSELRRIAEAAHVRQLATDDSAGTDDDLDYVYDYDEHGSRVRIIPNYDPVDARLRAAELAGRGRPRDFARRGSWPAADRASDGDGVHRRTQEVIDL